MSNHADSLLGLRVSEGARIAYSTLGPEDRRIVDAWFDHLQNWRNDEFIRSRSKRLDSVEEMYVFQTSTEIIIAFQIAVNEVIVLSIFRKETLRTFEAALA